MLKFALLLSAVIVTAELNQEDRSPTRIRSLIVDLGSDMFVVRERAEAQLLRIGIDAFAELKQATLSDDVEVSMRSKRILSRFEMIYRGKENESVRILVDEYAKESNVASKTQYLWILADPSECPNGEGLRTLCRVARFDLEHALRAEAVKCLIASPPPTPTKRKDWFQTLRTVFAEPGDDELLRLVGDYAALSIDIDILREGAEKKADAHEKETGTPIEYPVPFTVPEELRNRVLAFTDRLAAFQSKPENNTVQPGHLFDILLFHAMAELQDAVGLTAERDRTLEAALAIRTEKMRSDNPLFPVDPLDETSFSEHHYAAAHLEMRSRFLWAERHLQLVIAEAPIVRKVEAHRLLWFSMQMRAQYREAIELHERCIEWLKSVEYTTKRNDSNSKIKEYQAARDFCLAKIEAEAGNWTEAKELIDRSLQNDPIDCDAVILRYEVCKHLPDLDENERQRTKRYIDEVLNHTERKFQRREINMSVATMCNQMAWLLANTDGDFPTALALIRITIKAEPEVPTYLDTMAHVYALGKDYPKAVEVQKEAVRLAPEATSLRLALEHFRKQAKTGEK